jgi:hypothetical protein
MIPGGVTVCRDSTKAVQGLGKTQIRVQFSVPALVLEELIDWLFGWDDPVVLYDEYDEYDEHGNVIIDCDEDVYPIPPRLRVRHRRDCRCRRSLFNDGDIWL